MAREAEKRPVDSLFNAIEQGDVRWFNKLWEQQQNQLTPQDKFDALVVACSVVHPDLTELIMNKGVAPVLGGKSVLDRAFYIDSNFPGDFSATLALLNKIAAHGDIRAMLTKSDRPQGTVKAISTLAKGRSLTESERTFCEYIFDNIDVETYRGSGFGEAKNPLLLDAHGHKDIVQMLIDRGAKPNTALSAFKYPSSYRFMEEDLQTIRALVPHASAQVIQPWQIYELVKGGALEEVNNVLDKPGQLSKSVLNQCLIGACTENNLSLAQKALQKGAGANADTDGTTVLMLASATGNVRLVEMLLEHNANAKIATTKGADALRYAAKGGHLAVVHLLLEMSDVSQESLDNALLTAAEHCYAKIAERLLIAGANPNARKQALIKNDLSQDFTPLICATHPPLPLMRVKEGQTRNDFRWEGQDLLIKSNKASAGEVPDMGDTIKVLLDYGANPKARGTRWDESSPIDAITDKKNRLELEAILNSALSGQYKARPKKLIGEFIAGLPRPVRERAVDKSRTEPSTEQHVDLPSDSSHDTDIRGDNEVSGAHLEKLEEKRTGRIRKLAVEFLAEKN